MFKTISAALAFSSMCTAEQQFTDGYYHYSEHLGDYPPFTTPLTFVQTAGQENFQILMDGTTKGVPDPPQLGQSATFTIGGIATHPITIDKLEFICHLFGAKVYDE